MNEFLKNFIGIQYRFIDESEKTRGAVKSQTYREDLNREGFGAFFTVNGFEGNPVRENMSVLNAFFADIDGTKELPEFPLIPSYIVETKNGFHVYWMLDEPVLKAEVTEEVWNEAVGTYEAVLHAVITRVGGDRNAKDPTRILRVPGSLYWKGSGEAWKEGTDKAPFTIAVKEYNAGARYSIREMEEVFGIEQVARVSDGAMLPKVSAKKAEAEKLDFFNRVDEKYPVAERDSFKRLISGHPESLPPNAVSRNQALLITASLMKRAGWDYQEALAHINKIGWHGIEKERGGAHEIVSTIQSAYKNNYIFSIKHPIIDHNMSDEERMKMTTIYTIVMKDRKEVDKTRFANYEYEILNRFPHMKRTGDGAIFNYENGVYRLMTRSELANVILNALYDDMLWGYRTSRCVSDKLACLVSILPELELSKDHGVIANVKNGLLNIVTRELSPHTPNFVSLVQYPVEYDRDAKCPVWEACMRDWMAGEEAEEKTKLLQQFSGYCLSSSMKYAAMMFLIGDGGNGKSTFADTIAMVIGDRATARISLEDIYTHFGMAGLIGKRLNVVEEISGNYFQSHKIKQLVSGEEVEANIKYEKGFKFRPQAKFLFAVNQMPRVDDVSSASERRILVVHFKNNFRFMPNTDLRFEDGSLAQELPGILNWMLDGAASLHRDKVFVKTEEHKEIIAEYREENSSVDGFVATCCVEKQGEVLRVKDLYEVYKNFCKQDGRKGFKSAISFSKELKAMSKRTGKFSFMSRDHGKEGARIEGLELHEDWTRNFISTYSPSQQLRDF